MRCVFSTPPQSSYTRRAALGLLVIFAVAAGLGMQNSKPIEVPSLSVVDKLGVERIRMALGKRGAPYLAFYDQKKVNRISLSEGEDGTPNLVFFDSLGRARTGIRLDADGSPALAMFDEHHRNLVSIAIVEGSPGIVAYGHEDEAVGLRVGAGPSPQLVLSDRNKVTRLRIELGDGGKPSLIFVDKDGKEENR